jgi:hypothetical protein
MESEGEEGAHKEERGEGQGEGDEEGEVQGEVKVDIKQSSFKKVSTFLVNFLLLLPFLI